MATTAAETSSTSGTKPEGNSTSRKRDRKRTTLDEHIDKPSTMEPGDAPFDTTDPDERAVSVSPDKAAAARGGYQTVNAVVPMPKPEDDDDGEKPEARTEKYKLRGPDGKWVTVTRDLETGESKAS